MKRFNVDVIITDQENGSWRQGRVNAAVYTLEVWRAIVRCRPI